MTQLGVGAMLGALAGNASTVESYHKAMGRTIASVTIDDVDRSREDGSLTITFTDGAKLTVWDAGRSCCESRYITCDDDLSCMIGKTLGKVELKSGPDEPDDYGDTHETAFVEIAATDGTCITATTHNEHNGYYGGFCVRLNFQEPHP